LIEATGARNNLSDECLAALKVLDFAYEYQVSELPPRLYAKAWENEVARIGVLNKTITSPEDLLKALASPREPSVRKMKV